MISRLWLQILNNYHTLWVAYSGGLDSSVLLWSLSQHPHLLQKLRAVHVNHGLSPNADLWETHCENTCKALHIPLTAYSLNLSLDSNVEESARNARYQVFKELVNSDDCLVLGHHRDDQAETLLLQLFRGSGVDGLAGMSALNPFSKGFIARPFLTDSRAALELFAREHHLSWVDDESNLNCTYSRNFLRHNVIPLLKEKWPQVVGNLARTAQHLQEAKENLEALSEFDNPHTQESSLVISPLLDLNIERTKNVVRTWIKHHKVSQPSTNTLTRIVQEVIYAKPGAQPSVEWGASAIKRYQDRLYLLVNEEPTIPEERQWTDFPAPLSFGECILKAEPSAAGLQTPIDATLSVRCRNGGETFRWHGQTRSLKKVFQEWKILPWERDRIPLVFINGELAAVVGYAISDVYFCSQSSEPLFQITSL